MLKVYTGNTAKVLEDLKCTYEFPENGMSPWEQLEWVDNHIEEFKNKDITIKTFSPYIMNYLNVFLIKGELNEDNFDAEEYYSDIDPDGNEEIVHFNLKIMNSATKELGHILLDTRSLSEPISWIYEQYNIIKNDKE